MNFTEGEDSECVKARLGVNDNCQISEKCFVRGASRIIPSSAEDAEALLLSTGMVMLFLGAVNLK